MKKLVLSLMAAVALMFIPQALTAVNFVQYLATYGNSLTVGTDTLGGVTYSTVRYGDLYNGGAPGMPSLPIDYIRFSVPYNATNFTVTASPSRWSTANLSYLLYPCQMPWIPNDSIAPPIMLPDTAAYYSGVSYPSQMAWVADEGFLAGENHIVTVAVMPFRYTHSSTSDEVRKCRKLTVRLNYELSDSLAMYPIVRNDSALREEGYQLAQSMVVNPNQVKSFSYGFSNPVGPSEPGDPINPNGGLGGDGLNFHGDPGELGPNEPDSTWTNMGEIIMSGHFPYLIVTTSDLKHSVRRIAALKRQKGYNVKVVTLDDVFSSPCSRPGDVIGKGNNAYLTFTDNAGKLRQYIRYYFENLGTKYVLLAGSNIPYREIAVNLENGPINCHGDLYYSDMNGDWSEFIKIDTHPDLFVGRLLGRTPSQLEAYTDKLYRYELNPGKGNYSYLGNALYTEGKDFINGLQTIKSELNNIFINHSITECPNGNYPKGNDVLDSIHEIHPAFMFSLNHGEPSCIKTYGSDSLGVRYFLWAIDSVKILPGIVDNMETGNGLNRMMNKNYPMIYYSLSCETMPYYKIPGFNIDMNFGESFTMGKDYGGPVYMGNTATSTTSTIYLATEFVKQLKKGHYKLGEADILSKESFSDKMLSIIHNYLGDPTLEFWKYTPREYKNLSVQKIDSIYNISGITTIPSTIAYYCNDGRNKSYRVSQQTVALNIPPNSCTMIYSSINIPYILPLELQNIAICKSQYVIASDVIAGNYIDSSRSEGDVVIKNGIEYEIEASGTVALQDGFKVEKGAYFAVYPACF